MLRESTYRSLKDSNGLAYLQVRKSIGAEVTPFESFRARTVYTYIHIYIPESRASVLDRESAESDYG